VDFLDNQEDNNNNGFQPDGSGFPVYSPVIVLGVAETDNTVDFGLLAPAELGKPYVKER
jgi:hypothetical protein